MRFYSFININLSPSESLKATSNMVQFINQLNEPEVKEWAQNHKTTVIVSGGYTPALVSLFLNLIKYTVGKYVITKDLAENLEDGHRDWNAVGVLIPPEVYDSTEIIRSPVSKKLSSILNIFQCA